MIIQLGISLNLEDLSKSIVSIVVQSQDGKQVDRLDFRVSDVVQPLLKGHQ